MKTIVLLGFVALFTVNCATVKTHLSTMVMADPKPDIEVIVYGPDGTTPVQKVVVNDKRRKTVYFDAVFASTKEAHYRGAGFGINEEGMGMFRFDALRRSAYRVSTSKKILKAPENVEVAEIDVGGLKVGELSTVTKRIEWIFYPQLSIPVPGLSYNGNQKMKRGLQWMIEPRLGIGWEFHHYWDSTTYNLYLLNDKGERIKIPFTDDHGEDYFAGNVAINSHIGPVHVSAVSTVDWRGKGKLAIQLGAIWF